MRMEVVDVQREIGTIRVTINAENYETALNIANQLSTEELLSMGVLVPQKVLKEEESEFISNDDNDYLWLCQD